MAKIKKSEKQATGKNFSPRQIDFALRYYLPTSPTYGNALQSAIQAGYSEKYAKNVTIKAVEWMEKIVVEIGGNPTDKRNLVEKAKKVLNRSLDSKDGKLAQDTAKFIAKTDSEFAEKQDITSNGNALAPIVTVKFAEPTNTWKNEHGEQSNS